MPQRASHTHILAEDQGVKAQKKRGRQHPTYSLFMPLLPKMSKSAEAEAKSSSKSAKKCRNPSAFIRKIGVFFPFVKEAMPRVNNYLHTRFRRLQLRETAEKLSLQSPVYGVLRELNGIPAVSHRAGASVILFYHSRSRVGSVMRFGREDVPQSLFDRGNTPGRSHPATGMLRKRIHAEMTRFCRS